MKGTVLCSHCFGVTDAAFESHRNAAMAPISFEDQCKVSVCRSGRVPTWPRLLFHPFSSQTPFLSRKSFVSSRCGLTPAVSLFLLSGASFLFSFLSDSCSHPSFTSPARTPERPPYTVLRCPCSDPTLCCELPGDNFVLCSSGA